MRIAVIGLDQVRRQIKQIDPALAREFKTVFDESAEPVVLTARARVPKRSHRLEQSIRARATMREGRVRMGTPKRVAYAGWIEFGGVRRGPGSRRAERPFVRGGRYMFPAFYESRQNQELIFEAMNRGMDRVTRRAGLT